MKMKYCCDELKEKGKKKYLKNIQTDEVRPTVPISMDGSDYSPVYEQN